MALSLHRHRPVPSMSKPGRSQLGAYRVQAASTQSAMPRLVDTRESLSEMLEACRNVQQLAFDIEGIALSRHGKACLLAVATSPTSVWVVDTVTLGKAAFEPVDSGLSLKALLESPMVSRRGSTLTQSLSQSSNRMVDWRLRYRAPT
jgi:hypothetical protein